MASCNPDAYLQDLYRNYMEIPPVEKRKIHAIFVLETLEEEGEERVGEEGWHRMKILDMQTEHSQY